MKSTLRIVFNLLAFPCLFSESIQAQELLPDFVQTNGTVRAVAKIGDTLIVGGNFSKVVESKSTSNYLTIVDKLNNNKLNVGNDEPNGTVYAAVEDSKGGFYIGGLFSKVGNFEANNIAHIDSNGKVDTTFKLKVDNAVKDLIYRNDTLYVGGNFISATTNGSFKSDANISKFSNNKNSFLKADGKISKIISDNNGGWYFIGDFTFINGVTRDGFAHVDSLGNLLPETISSIGAISTMVLHGDTLYFAGSFTSVQGQTRTMIASINVNSWQLTNWAPVVNISAISKIEISDHLNSIVVFGTFTSINSLPRTRLASFELTTGNLKSWSPAFSGTVTSMFAKNNDLFIAGTFTSIKGINRTNIAIIDMLADTVKPFNPNVNGTIESMAYLNTDTLLIGGLFSKINNINRNGFSGLVISTSQFTSNWNLGTMPDYIGHTTLSVGIIEVIDNNVYVGMKSQYSAPLLRYSSLLIINKYSEKEHENRFISDNSILSFAKNATDLIVAGDFTSCKNKVMPRFGILSYNLKSNNITNLLVLGSVALVEAIAIKDSILFVADLNKLQMVKMKNSSIMYTQMIYNINGTSNSIFDMYVQNNFLFIGGAFIQIDTGLSTAPTRGRLASFEILPNWKLKLTPLSFYCTGGDLYKLKVFNNTLYFCGSFTQVASNSRNYLAAINLTTNTLTNLTGASSALYSLDVDSTYIYVGGLNRYLRYNSINNTLNSNTVLTNTIYSVLLSTNKLFLGGNYTLLNFNTYARSSIFAYDLKNKSVLSWNPQVLGTNNIVYAIEVYNREFFIAGDFYGISGKGRARLALMSIDSINPLQTNFNFSITSSRITSLKIADSILCIGGLFNVQINGTPTSNFVLYNLKSKSFIVNYPSPNQEVFSFALKDSLLFLGGNFSSVYGQSRSYLAAINMKNFNLHPFAPLIDSTVYSIHINENNLYVGGRFSLVNGNSRLKFASFNVNDLQLSPYQLNFNQYVQSIVAKDSIVYFGGNFNLVNNISRQRFAAFDFHKNSLLDFQLNSNDIIYNVFVDSNSLYISGKFKVVNNRNMFSIGMTILPSNFKVLNSSLKTVCETNDLAVNLKFDGSYFKNEEFELHNLDSLGNFKSKFNYINTGNLVIPQQNLFRQGDKVNFKFFYPKANVYSNSYKVNLIKSDTLFITNLSATDSICKGDSILLKSSEANNFRWVLDDSVILSNLNDSIYVYETGSYAILPVDTLSCKSASEKISITKLETPKVPVISMNSISAEFCENDSIILYSSELTNIKWYKNGVLLNHNSDSLIVKETAYFQLEHFNPSLNSCNSFSEFVQVDKRLLPNKPKITAIKDTLISDSASLYQWYLNDTLLLGETSRTTRAFKSGNYKVEVFNNYNCANYSNPYEVTIQGIGNETNAGVKIFPNPSHGSIEIISTEKIKGYKIHDLLGRIVLSGENSNNRINTIELTNGVYIIYLELENKEIVKEKIIVEN